MNAREVLLKAAERYDPAPVKQGIRPAPVHCRHAAAYVAKRHWWLDPAHAAAVVLAMVFLNAAFATFVACLAAVASIHVPWWAWAAVVVAFSAAVMQPWRRPT